MMWKKKVSFEWEEVLKGWLNPEYKEVIFKTQIKFNEKVLVLLIIILKPP